MTIFTWLLLLPIIELSYTTAEIDGYQYPPYTIGATVGVELQLFDNLYIKGGSETFQTPSGHGTFHPFRSIYKAEGGIRVNGVEAGVRHECTHKVTSPVDAPTYQHNITQVFIRYGGRL